MFVGGRRLGLVPVALCLALAGSLAGCSGSSDSPTTLPPISTSPSTPPSTQPPADPKAAAVTVVREYFRLLNNLEHDMNVGAFARLETAKCPCRKFLRSLRQVDSNGQHYFGHATVTHTTAVRDADGVVEVLTSYDSTIGGIKDASGKVVTSQPGRKGITENFYLRNIGGRWLVENIVLVKRGSVR